MEHWIKRIETKETIKASKLVKKVYDKSEVGCCCHVVLDDYNVQDSTIDSCLEDAKETQCKECIECMECFSELSEAAKLSAIAIAKNEPDIELLEYYVGRAPE